MLLSNFHFKLIQTKPLASVFLIKYVVMFSGPMSSLGLSVTLQLPDVSAAVGWVVCLSRESCLFASLFMPVVLLL